MSSFLLAPSSQQKRQLDNPPSQVKTLNLSTSESLYLWQFLLQHIIRLFTNPFCFLPLQLVFPVLVLDYFIDNKNHKTLPSECSLYVGQIYTENDMVEDP
ncbi:hypothetical protein AMECASPLE_023334 [Ameca splendens]|uniref:Uncharacterized protein n=1 Tax=Ameca splendens TaxID=208324 RepID=A0ABV0YFC0_9TELE